MLDYFYRIELNNCEIITQKPKQYKANYLNTIDLLYIVIELKRTESRFDLMVKAGFLFVLGTYNITRHPVVDSPRDIIDFVFRSSAVHEILVEVQYPAFTSFLSC